MYTVGTVTTLSYHSLLFFSLIRHGSIVKKSPCHPASPTCHAERSEGSVAIGNEMLRCAQHDRAGPFY
jgi:hypothetical protein